MFFQKMLYIRILIHKKVKYLAVVEGSVLGCGGGGLVAMVVKGVGEAGVIGEVKGTLEVEGVLEVGGVLEDVVVV